MGTDNFFHRRKAKDAKALKRRGPVRDTYDKVLIVCEGEKTEPNYFEGLIDYYKINTANVRIDGSCGSSPLSVVNYAIALYREEQQKGDPYDRVYCVIDRDAHQDFEAAIQKLKSQRPSGAFYSAVSVPSFEYWLLCHYVYSRAGFTAAGGKSSGDAVLRELRRYWPDYEKSCSDTFKKLLDSLDFAKANAKRGLDEAARSGAYNPSSEVFELVDYLQSIMDK